MYNAKVEVKLNANKPAANLLAKATKELWMVTLLPYMCAALEQEIHPLEQ